MPASLNDPNSTQVDYQARVDTQIQQFANTAIVWKLPPIYHYWMQKHIRPRFNQVMDCTDAREFYLKHIQAVQQEVEDKPLMIVSIGSGDCVLETGLAIELKRRGINHFKIECLELSKIRLQRARIEATKQGIIENLVLTECDLNQWQSNQSYDVIIAHHSLHHIVELEHLFDTLKQTLSLTGLFLTADMIGRNGHMRWPEALEVIEGLWSIIPDHYKFNYQFNQYHAQYLNWDCSKRGFEGIRSQDVLPALVDRFAFKAFLGYGNIIDPFIERGYGHNLDPDNMQDCQFIDFVENLNTKFIDVGLAKPTMMFAVMGHQATETKCFRHWTPDYCIRSY
ncbi:MAG: class I SAM-dependent methyltransferase [Elainella sp. Prado103]|jgi:2-polyprenyl-3-methyl-5-hydroxy-6-metoxy-1,4-benzoquinol methylase|nr:class I SAM-dependent methyltransferase [Elainella sp. Prado103]